jgi:hypothetical protein
MQNWKKVAIPDRMQSLEQDSRGYPVPVIILRDDNKRPHFQINDILKVEWCIKERRCSICGSELKADIWFSGGPLSALHPQGAYIDAPTHHECGQYAMQVCPYLSAPSYSKRLDLTTLNSAKFSGKAFVDPTVMDDRPPFFVLARAQDYTLKLYPGGRRVLLPFRPFITIECWDRGEQVSLDEAVRKNQAYFQLR